MKVKITLIDDDGKILEGETTLQLIGKGKAVVKPIVKVDSKTRKKKKETIENRIFFLLNEGLFKEPKTAKEVKDELGIRGFHYNTDSISMRLLLMVRTGKLRRIKEERGKNITYRYVNP